MFTSMELVETGINGYSLLVGLSVPNGSNSVQTLQLCNLQSATKTVVLIKELSCPFAVNILKSPS